MPGGSVVVVQVAMVAKIRRPWFNPTLGCGITSLGASFSLSSAYYYLIKVAGTK